MHSDICRLDAQLFRKWVIFMLLHLLRLLPFWSSSQGKNSNIEQFGSLTIITNNREVGRVDLLYIVLTVGTKQLSLSSSVDILDLRHTLKFSRGVRTAPNVPPCLLPENMFLSS